MSRMGTPMSGMGDGSGTRTVHVVLRIFRLGASKFEHWKGPRLIAILRAAKRRHPDATVEAAGRSWEMYSYGAH